MAREPLDLLLAGMRDPGDWTPPQGVTKEIRAVKLDLASQASIDADCAAIGDDFGRIDLLVNNAGLMTGGLLEEQDVDAVYAMFQVNLIAVAHLSSKVVPAMVERGAGMIVNNASISGYAYFPAATTYAASKAGVVALSESLRRELAPTGVKVLHLVTPGVRTEMLDDTEEVYGRHLDTSDWPSIPAAQWADKVADAIRKDAHILRPGGRIEVARLLSRGPALLLDKVTARGFSRAPRDR